MRMSDWSSDVCSSDLESFLVRADARLRSVADIEEAVIATRAGVPVRVKDVGQVVIGGAVRTGSGSVGGSEAVISTILMLTGENSRIVANRVADKLVEINKTLPPDVVASQAYHRSKLVNATIAPVGKNLRSEESRVGKKCARRCRS